MFTGGLSNGYGQVNMRGTVRRLHRIAYEVLCGPVPDGLDLDHLCRNRACFNPLHLDPVSRSVNLRRGRTGWNGGKRNREKTHCHRGHEFTPANTGRTATGGRYCKACRRKEKP